MSNNRYGICVITSSTKKDEVFQKILDKYLEEHESEIEDYLKNKLDDMHICFGNGLIKELINTKK